MSVPLNKCHIVSYPSTFQNYIHEVYIANSAHVRCNVWLLLLNSSFFWVFFDYFFRKNYRIPRFGNYLTALAQGNCERAKTKYRTARYNPFELKQVRRFAFAQKLG